MHLDNTILVENDMLIYLYSLLSSLVLVSWLWVNFSSTYCTDTRVMGVMLNPQLLLLHILYMSSILTLFKLCTINMFVSYYSWVYKCISYLIVYFNLRLLLRRLILSVVASFECDQWILMFSIYTKEMSFTTYMKVETCLFKWR